MKAFAAFILFVTAIFLIGRILRDNFAPGFPDDGLVLISGLAAAVLVWIWLRRTNAATPADHPPTLEDLERALAATSALVWEAAPAPNAAKEKSAAKAERAAKT